MPLVSRIFSRLRYALQFEERKSGYQIEEISDTRRAAVQSPEQFIYILLLLFSCDNKANLVLGKETKNDFSHAYLEQPRNKSAIKPIALLSIGLLLRLMSKESLFLTINLVLATVKVCLMRLDHLRLLKELVAEDQDQVDRNALHDVLVSTLRRTETCCRLTYKVTSDEILIIKVSVFAFREDIEVLRESDQDAEEQSDAGSGETEWCSVCELVVGDTLRSARANEENVSRQE